MTKKKKDETAVEYVSKEQAQIHRKSKTIAVENTCTALISRHGTVTIDLFVDDARDTTHPLHEYFEWDDAVCGIKHRRDQARAMIMASRFVALLQENGKQKPKPAITVKKKAVQVRRFLPTNDSSGFLERPDILNDAENRKALVEKKLSALRGWCRSVVDIEELQPVRESVLAAIA